MGEPKWTDVDKPCIVRCQHFDLIFIANSDAAGRANADAAIDQAHRAVSEIVRV